MSDHFSGPRAIAGPAADICDLYAFPSPSAPGRLVLAMTVYPEARLKEHFSDAITYSFRLRPATLPGSGTQIEVGDEAAEVAFDLAFDAARGAHQAGRCVSTLGGSVPVAVNDEAGTRGDGLRVYAGVRSDPFFLDIPAFLRSRKQGQLRFSEHGKNSVDGANVLAIVVEVDRGRLTARGQGPLWAVAAETRVTSKVPIRIERIGRPEIKNHLLHGSDPLYGDLELRDLYNLEDPYHLSGAYRTAYRSRLSANLAMFDRLDGKVDWSLGENDAHPLTELLLSDRLIVDLSKPFAEGSFLEIEQALLGGRAHSSCGGRAPNDDVMDTLFTLYIGGLDSPRIRDGVDQPTTPAGPTFPYLAPPNHGPRTVMGRVAARLKFHTGAGH